MYRRGYTCSESNHQQVIYVRTFALGNGSSAAKHLLKWGAKQRCRDPIAFSQDIIDLFQRECNIHAPLGIDLDKVRSP